MNDVRGCAWEKRGFKACMCACVHVRMCARKIGNTIASFWSQCVNCPTSKAKWCDYTVVLVAVTGLIIAGCAQVDTKG